jgi:hypothetical protein
MMREVEVIHWKCWLKLSMISGACGERRKEGTSGRQMRN